MPKSDYEHDRFLYVCALCGWWGHDPLRIEFPPKEDIASQRQRPARKRQSSTEEIKMTKQRSGAGRMPDNVWRLDRSIVHLSWDRKRTQL